MEIKLVYTTSAQLNNLPVIDGQVTVLTDKTAFYYDMNGSRHSFIDKVPADLGFGYGTCSTATSTAAKTSSITGYSLATGGLVAIKFSNAVNANATLNISSKGAKPIYYKGQAVTAGIINANSTALMMYDGTNYNIVSVDDDIIDDSQLSTSSTYSSQKIEDTYINQDASEDHTASTSFESYSGGLLSSCKVSLSPNQDLHGYDSPWVGGAGKNKLPMTVESIKANNTSGTWNGNTYTHVNGVKVTILTDDDNNVIGFELNETTNGAFDFRFSPTNVSLPSGNYIWSIQNTINLDGLWVSIYNPNAVAIITKTTTSANYTCNGTFGGGYIYSNSGNTFNNIVIKPMLRLATDTDPTFEPYENKCSISGHTQVEVGDDGKNLCDPTVIALNGLGGDHYVATTLPVGSVVARIKGGKTYTVSIKNAQTIFTSTCKEYPTVDAPMIDNYAGSGGLSVTSKTITTSVGANYLVVNTGSNNYEEIQIEEGSTATPYEPYNGYQVTVNLGGTYYSGTLDVVSGVFVPDTAKYVLTDVSALESYTTDTSVDSWGSWARIKRIEYPSIKEDVSSELASSCKVVAYADRSVNTHDNRCYVNFDSVIIRASVDENVTTVNELFAIFENCEFILPLATPLTIQLSPTMVKALVGENHLSAPLDGQEITESKYRELFTWDEVEEIAQKIADSKIDNIYTSYNTTFSSAFTEARYVKKIYEAPALTALQIVLSGATSITFNHQLIFSDSQTCCELIQYGSGARIGITDVAISQGSVTFTFDSALTKAIGFRCRITDDFVS